MERMGFGDTRLRSTRRMLTNLGTNVCSEPARSESFASLGFASAFNYLESHHIPSGQTVRISDTACNA
ncbi:MAG: hypothetical protein RL768_2382 [Nitrospirota bacterium]|jgi:hypothetical protein